MGRDISLQSRILDLAYYKFNASTSFDDNFSIRLSQRLADEDVLDEMKIKKIVKNIKTVFFRVNKINRDEFSKSLFNDLKRCELLEVRKGKK